MTDIAGVALEHRVCDSVSAIGRGRLIQPRSMPDQVAGGGRVGDAQLVARRLGGPLVAVVPGATRPPELRSRRRSATTSAPELAARGSTITASIAQYAFAPRSHWLAWATIVAPVISGSWPMLSGLDELLPPQPA